MKTNIFFDSEDNTNIFFTGNLVRNKFSGQVVMVSQSVDYNDFSGTNISEVEQGMQVILHKKNYIQFRGTITIKI